MVFEYGSQGNSRSRFSLQGKLFLHPLDRGERDIAEFRHIPQALTFPEQLDDLCVLLLCLLLTGGHNEVDW